MKRASAILLSFTTFCYLLSLCFGFVAFGKDTKGNILAEFGSMKLNWPIRLANACVVIHLTGGYQVYINLKFLFTCICTPYEFITRSHIIILHSFRTLHVAATIRIAIAFPDINAILRVGALRILSGAILLLCLFTLVGSIAGSL
ncbi:probable amino acid permease 7 [Asparagus officinalis]|uniref:probable amino acid permease 7 n=1 Tax=Asparagus officinalis TaxID=4686 RepID=UPI00098E69D0|nr:probable amino acid permease 7 [Asparagus officinalis]